MQPETYHLKRYSIQSNEGTPPSIFIMIPFEPKMTSKSTLEFRLQHVTEVAESRLRRSAEGFSSKSLINKFKKALAAIDYSTYKKSLVLFVSALEEKRYYLDFEVQETILVNEPFNVLHILQGKKQQQRYLLLMMGLEGARIFLGVGNKLTRLMTNKNTFLVPNQEIVKEPAHGTTFVQDSYQTGVKEFLQHIDDGLGILLKSYPYPLFLFCDKNLKNAFSNWSKNSHHITAYIDDDLKIENELQPELLMKPYLNNWQKIKDKFLLSKIVQAKHQKNCAAGMFDVWIAANQKRGQLLIVEKNFIFPAIIKEDNTMIPIGHPLPNVPAPFVDAVDLVVEKILENGGEVELVSENVLNEHLQIALIFQAINVNQY